MVLCEFGISLCSSVDVMGGHLTHLPDSIPSLDRLYLGNTDDINEIIGQVAELLYQHQWAHEVGNQQLSSVYGYRGWCG